MLRCIVVRAAVLCLCVACAGSMRPAVIPNLSELPHDDPVKRNAVLDSAHAEPGPEHKPTSKKAQKAETYAATAAAALGFIFSSHKNVTIGVQAPVDENRLFEKPRKLPPSAGTGSGSGEGSGSAAPPAEPVDSTELVPWIQLAPRPVR